MAFDQQQIERLQVEIALKRSALGEERASLLKLENEIEAFARQYDRIIGPLESELDTIRQEIEALQSRQSNNINHGSLWGPGYSSFEESFDAKYRRPNNSNNPTISAPSRHVDENELRTIYRRLARKYHPDTTTNAQEKSRLTLIMAQINAAYRAKNIDELRAWDGDKRGKMPPPSVENLTPREPSYYDLLKVSDQLDEELKWIRSAYKRLLSGPLMALKIEASIARSQGRDLLREVAAKIRQDLDSARQQRDQLRR